MKKTVRLVGLLIVILMSFAGSSFADTTRVSGAVSGEWTQEGSPYIVVDSTWVPANDTLFILPGVSVLFVDPKKIHIFGNLIANGTEQDSIRFAMLGYDPENGVIGSGELIKVHKQNDIQRFSYCAIRNCRSLIYAELLTGVEIRHSAISCYYGPIGGRPFEFITVRYEDCNISYDPAYRRRAGVGVHTGVAYLRRCIIRANIALDTGYILIEDCEIWGSGPGIYDATVQIIRSHYYKPDDSTYIGAGLAGTPGLFIDSSIEGSLLIQSSRGVGCIQIRNSTAFDLHGDCDTMYVIRSEFDEIWLNEYIKLMIDEILTRDCIFYIGCRTPNSIAEISHSRLMRGPNASTALRLHHQTPRNTTNIHHNVIMSRAYLAPTITDNFKFNHNTIVRQNDGSYWSVFELIPSWYTNVKSNIILSDTSRWQTMQISTTGDCGIPHLSYNSIYAFSESQWGLFYPAYEPDSTNIIADPLIVSLNPLDPHLQEGSPCIDTGDPESPLDPDGTRADIGAFYYPQPEGVGNQSGIPNEFFFRPFPNPANSRIYLSVPPGSAPFPQCLIFDLQGRLVRMLPVIQSKDYRSLLSIDVGSLPSGNYLLHIGGYMRQHTYKVTILK